MGRAAVVPACREQAREAQPRVDEPVGQALALALAPGLVLGVLGQKVALIQLERLTAKGRRVLAGGFHREGLVQESLELDGVHPDLLAAGQAVGGALAQDEARLLLALALGLERLVQRVERHAEGAVGPGELQVRPERVDDAGLGQELPPVGQEQVEELTRLLTAPGLRAQLLAAPPDPERPERAHAQGVLTRGGRLVEPQCAEPGGQRGPRHAGAEGRYREGLGRLRARVAEERRLRHQKAVVVPASQLGQVSHAAHHGLVLAEGHGEPGRPQRHERLAARIAAALVGGLRLHQPALGLGIAEARVHRAQSQAQHAGQPGITGVLGNFQGLFGEGLGGRRLPPPPGQQREAHQGLGLQARHADGRRQRHGLAVARLGARLVLAHERRVAQPNQGDRLGPGRLLAPGPLEALAREVLGGVGLAHERLDERRDQRRLAVALGGGVGGLVGDRLGQNRSGLGQPAGAQGDARLVLGDLGQLGARLLEKRLRGSRVAAVHLVLGQHDEQFGAAARRHLERQGLLQVRFGQGRLHGVQIHQGLAGESAALALGDAVVAG
ncbi:hypothetical protein D3C72_790590 [compost metagenome]